MLTVFLVIICIILIVRYWYILVPVGVIGGLASLGTMLIIWGILTPGINYLMMLVGVGVLYLAWLAFSYYVSLIRQ